MSFNYCWNSELDSSLKDHGIMISTILKCSILISTRFNKLFKNGETLIMTKLLYAMSCEFIPIKYFLKKVLNKVCRINGEVYLLKFRSLRFNFSRGQLLSSFTVWVHLLKTKGNVLKKRLFNSHLTLQMKRSNVMKI